MKLLSSDHSPRLVWRSASSKGGPTSGWVPSLYVVHGLQGSVTVNWLHRESARARMRVLVKRILRHHGYPPDLQDAAVQTVLQQAEALSAAWNA